MGIHIVIVLSASLAIILLVNAVCCVFDYRLTNRFSAVRAEYSRSAWWSIIMALVMLAVLAAMQYLKKLA